MSLSFSKMKKMYYQNYLCSDFKDLIKLDLICYRKSHDSDIYSFIFMYDGMSILKFNYWANEYQIEYMLNDTIIKLPWDVSSSFISGERYSCKRPFILENI